MIQQNTSLKFKSHHIIRLKSSKWIVIQIHEFAIFLLGFVDAFPHILKKRKSPRCIDFT